MPDRSERLAIIVTAEDLASGKLGKVRTELAAMGTAGKLSAIGLGTGIAAVRKGEAAVKHLGERVSSLAGPLGFIGLTAAGFGLAGMLEHGIEKASSMAYAVEKLTGVTGLGVHQASQLVAVFEKFGIAGDGAVKIAGFAEKALGKLSAGVGSVSDGVSKLTKFESLYGINLHDNAGKAVDFGTELSRVADYYNSNASAGNKAAVAATLFGKGYVQLIPILKLGSKGLEEAAQEADNLGLTLRNAQDVQNVHDFIAAQREAKDALAGVEVQLGLLVMPDLTGGFRTLTRFVSTHKAEIHQFFADGLKVAEGLAAFVTGTLIPDVQGVGSALLAGWNMIPAPLRDMIVKGAIADRTIKFLFGFSPIHTIVNLAESGLSKALGAIIGKNIVQPVFVTNQVPGVGGIPGAAAAAGSGALGVVAAVAAPVIAVAAVAGVAAYENSQISDQSDALKAQAAAYAKAANDEQLANSIKGVSEQLAQMNGIGANAYGQKGTTTDVLNLLIAEQNRRSSMLPDTGSEAAATRRALEAQYEQDKSYDTRSEAAMTRQAAAAEKVLPVLDALHASFHADFAKLIHATKPADVQASAKKVAAEITKGVGSLSTTNHVLETLKAKLANTHDPKTASVLRAAIHAVERKVPGREWVERQLTAAHKQTTTTAELKAIQRRLLARGDTHAANEVAHLIQIRNSVSALPSQLAFLQSTQNVREHADGGMAYPGRLYRVNERRAEYFEPVVPTMIHSNAPGLMAAGAARATMVAIQLAVHVVSRPTIGVRNIADKTASELRMGKLTAG